MWFWFNINISIFVLSTDFDSTKYLNSVFRQINEFYGIFWGFFSIAVTDFCKRLLQITLLIRYRQLCALLGLVVVKHNSRRGSQTAIDSQWTILNKYGRDSLVQGERGYWIVRFLSASGSLHPPQICSVEVRQPRNAVIPHLPVCDFSAKRRISQRRTGNSSIFPWFVFEVTGNVSLSHLGNFYFWRGLLFLQVPNGYFGTLQFITSFRIFHIWEYLTCFCMVFYNINRYKFSLLNF